MRVVIAITVTATAAATANANANAIVRVSEWCVSDKQRRVVKEIAIKNQSHSKRSLAAFPMLSPLRSPNTSNEYYRLQPLYTSNIAPSTTINTHRVLCCVRKAPTHKTNSRNRKQVFVVRMLPIRTLRMRVGTTRARGPLARCIRLCVAQLNARWVIAVATSAVIPLPTAYLLTLIHVRLTHAHVAIVSHFHCSACSVLLTLFRLLTYLSIVCCDRTLRTAQNFLQAA